MSLLYECINGVIQGGILEGTEGAREGEEIASLCVGKLRGMIAVEGDPNRMSNCISSQDRPNSIAVKYVALLAFNRIVASHPHLVSMHQDVIMGCIDDPDISIRLQALELGAGMVNSDNLVAVVERLLQQLRNAPATSEVTDDGRRHSVGVEPAADSDGEDPEERLRPTAEPQNDTPALPTEYRVIIIRQILEMCSKDTYANVVDFEWYIDTLVQLVRLVPAADQAGLEFQGDNGRNLSQEEDVTSAIGWELRNIAVRVSTVRTEAVKAANTLLSFSGNDNMAPGGQGVLAFAAWVVGEYFDSSALSYAALDSLIHPKAQSLSPIIICAYLQAIPKVLISAISHEFTIWGPERKTMVSLLVARVVHFLEPLTTHPNLEVQERSVEFLELMRVTLQAVASHDVQNHDGPLLLTRAIPQLFAGFELNPVAPAAQKKVPLPSDLNLDIPINSNLTGLLQNADQDFSVDTEAAEFDTFYNQRPIQKAISGPAIDSLPSLEPEISSYQQNDHTLSDSDALIRKRIQRRERNRDDPFYIGNDDASSGTSTPFHDILRRTNGEDVDVDSIPIMNLDLGDQALIAESSNKDFKKQKRKRPKKVHITKDETIDNEALEIDQTQRAPASEIGPLQRARDKAKKSLLQVDSSGLSSFSLDGGDAPASQLDIERQEAQDMEMAKALAEVERLRLEMQRASERIQATDGTPAEGILVKKKKKLKSKHPIGESQHRDETGVQTSSAQGVQDAEAAPVVKKKKKKRKPTMPDADNEKVVGVD